MIKGSAQKLSTAHVIRSLDNQLAETESRCLTLKRKLIDHEKIPEAKRTKRFHDRSDIITLLLRSKSESVQAHKSIIEKKSKILSDISSTVKNQQNTSLATLYFDSVASAITDRSLYAMNTMISIHVDKCILCGSQMVKNEELCLYTCTNTLRCGFAKHAFELAEQTSTTLSTQVHSVVHSTVQPVPSSSSSSSVSSSTVVAARKSRSISSEIIRERRKACRDLEKEQIAAKFGDYQQQQQQQQNQMMAMSGVNRGTLMLYKKFVDQFAQSAPPTPKFVIDEILKSLEQKTHIHSTSSMRSSDIDTILRDCQLTQYIHRHDRIVRELMGKDVPVLTHSMIESLNQRSTILFELFGLVKKDGRYKSPNFSAITRLFLEIDGHFEQAALFENHKTYTVLVAETEILSDICKLAAEKYPDMNWTIPQPIQKKVIVMM